jgi:hypothetical protein
MIRKHRHAVGVYALAASLICAAWIGQTVFAFAADSAPVFDTRSLLQVRWLAGFPDDVDDEVREIQSLALGLSPGSIVNISGVATASLSERFRCAPDIS